MNWQAKWSKPSWETEGEAPLFIRKFRTEKAVTSAVLRMTGMGTYEASINGVRVSEDVLAPGWTSYAKRLQVQTYEVTEKFPNLTQALNRRKIYARFSTLNQMQDVKDYKEQKEELAYLQQNCF